MIDDDDRDDDPGPASDLPQHERDYLVPSKDAQGHSVAIHCRVPAQVLRMVQMLIATKKYPFRTVSDVLRFATVHMSKRLSVSAGVPNVTAQATAIIEMLRDEELHHMFLASFQQLQLIVERSLNEKAVSEARRLVASVRAKVGQMPAGHWRTRYERELLARFGRLLDGDGGGVGLGRVDLLDEGDHEEEEHEEEGATVE